MLRVESVGTRQVADRSKSIWMKNEYENIELVKRNPVEGGEEVHNSIDG